MLNRSNKKLNIILFKDNNEIDKWISDYFANIITKKPKFVLGFTTCLSNYSFYKSLADISKINKIDWSNITTFNIEEYVGMSIKTPQSFYNQMWNHLFSKINIKKSNIHSLNGLADDLNLEAKRYEDLIDNKGGIDLQYLSIDNDGSIGYNKPGTSFDSHTHIVDLSTEFKENIDDIPSQVITAGIRTILNFKQVFMVISGKNMAEITKLALEGPITTEITASALQNHPNCTYILDEDSASLLDLSKHNILSNTSN